MSEIFERFVEMASVVGVEPALNILLLTDETLKSIEGVEQFAKELAEAGILLEDEDLPNVSKSLTDLVDDILLVLEAKSKGAKKKVRNVPVSKLKWVHRPKERKKLKKEGKVKFLGKNREGEPCCPYTNKDGTINCRMLHAAEVRASQHGYKEYAAKAKRLYQRYCAKDKKKK